MKAHGAMVAVPWQSVGASGSEAGGIRRARRLCVGWGGGGGVGEQWGERPVGVCG